MQTQKLRLGRFSVTILLAAAIVTLPLPATSTPENAQVQIKTIKVHVDQPFPGQPIQLPDEIPVEIRAQVLDLLEHTPAGQAVVIEPPNVQNQYADVINRVIKDAGVTLASAPTVSERQSRSPIPLKLEACAGWIVLIVAVVVILVVIYVVWKCCQLLDKPSPTNSSPSDPYPVIAQRPLTAQSTFTSTNTPSFNLDIQVSTDLSTSNWWTLATLTAAQAVEYTNDTPNTIWSVVVARNTNGALLASTIVSGTSTNGLTGARPLNIPYPGPTPEKLFLRTMQH